MMTTMMTITQTMMKSTETAILDMGTTDVCLRLARQKRLRTVDNVCGCCLWIGRPSGDEVQISLQLM